MDAEVCVRCDDGAGAPWGGCPRTGHGVDISKALLTYYDSHLARFGDTARGAAWPDEDGRQARFRFGLEPVLQHMNGRPFVLCDLGCGTGELHRHLGEAGLDHVAYVGIDRSEAAIAIARRKFPGATFHCLDILDGPAELIDQALSCDFVFANGLFTVKHEATHADMWRFMTSMLEAAWSRARHGVAFNVMSKIVDYERDDLFHVAWDDLARFLRGLPGATVGLRADRGFYEIMAHVVKSDDARDAAVRPATRGEADVVVPVCRPLLPTAAEVASHLAPLDRTRRYSNHGALAGRFAKRLAETIGTADDNLCLAASGTAGLVGAILARAGRATSARPIALCPAYTFAATALAAEAAGYEPHLVDVDPASWALTPDIAHQYSLLGRVGLVLVTAAYGRPVVQAPWIEFSRDTGIPVVIDAAAGFEGLCADVKGLVGEVPVVLSLHATKAFSTAEGGAIVCTDHAFIERAHGALNFGFMGTRECRMAGINGKLSEYHAAVGLAELDGWALKQAGFRRVADVYRRAAEAHGVAGRVVVGAPGIGSCYALYVAEEAGEASAVASALRCGKIDFRYWYGLGLQREPYFLDAPRGSLAQASRIAACIVGLPMAADLAAVEVERVVAAIARGVATRQEAGRERAA